MKNIIISFVFVSMTGFYANAIAFVISGDTEYASIPRDLIMQIINDGKLATNKADRKLGKKVGKSQNKIDKLSLKDELTNRQTNKLTKHENRIANLLNGIEVPDASALISESIVPESELPVCEKLDENQPGENVPEPSALGLLGLGLAGLGVARRFKRTAWFTGVAS
jgi:PEP-CTERM motif